MSGNVQNLLSEAQRNFAGQRFAEAEAALGRLLARQPGNLPAKVLLGVIYAKTKRPELAEKSFSEVLAKYPDQFDSLAWLANVKLGQRAYEESLALARRAVALQPRVAAGHNTLGLCLLSMRDSEGAVKAFERAASIEPNSAPSHHNLGLALRLRDDAFEACRAFSRAVELAPTERNFLELFRQQQVISAWPAAIRTLEAAHRRLPNSVAIAEALGFAYTRVNDKERGEAMFKQVWEMEPGVCKSYAIWLQEEGRFEESVELLKESLAIQPDQGAAYYCLAEAKAFELEGESLIARAKEVRESPRLNDLGRMYVDYALGKAYEQAKDHESAIRHFDLANEVAFQTFNEGRRLDPKVADENVDYLAQMFSPENLELLRREGSSDATPILIVGMIRSGTTLLDQILSSHPDVASAGEQPYWKLEGGRIVCAWNRGGIDPTAMPGLEQNYLATLRAIDPDSPRITDKMPLNYEHLGLIHACFPKAKIVHIRRNPVDTCLSIYMTHFGGGPNFAYRQENIVTYYRQYLRLMELWRSVLPESCLYELDYEELVRDREPVIREALEFCGLEWSDACLHHDENPTSVNTPSRWQARQPVYSSSVERWRKYEPWLGALLDLRDVAHPPIRPRAQRTDLSLQT